MEEGERLREQVEKLCRASSGLVGECHKLLEQVSFTIRRAHQFLTNGEPVASTSPRYRETRDSGASAASAASSWSRRYLTKSGPTGRPA